MSSKHADGIDILVISYQSPEYLKITLNALLEQIRGGVEEVRVWLWQNGSHPEALEVARAFADHPLVHKFHHSEENVYVRGPTNWMWSQARGQYFSKVDDDGLLPSGWLPSLLRAHEEVPEFGVIGCWRFLEQDFVPHLANKKIKSFGENHQLLQNHWVEGSGYLMKRACFDQLGELSMNQGFSSYCIDLAGKGWTNGWVYPFIYQVDLDDPRNPQTLLKVDADLMRRMPLGAHKRGIRTLEEWSKRRHEAAVEVQAASLDLRDYRGLRLKLRRLKKRARRWLSGRRRPSWNPNW